MNQNVIIPPPPPPGCDVIQIPVVGFAVEAEHAQIKSSLMESIRNTGGFGQMKLKHVPEEHRRLPGQPKPPPQCFPTGLDRATRPPGKNLPLGRAALMDDLSAALHQRQMKKEMRRTRGSARPVSSGSRPAQEMKVTSPATDESGATNF